MLKLSSDMQRSGVQPDVWTYASLIAACQSCGNRWREALAFYQDMQDKGEVLHPCRAGESDCSVILLDLDKVSLLAAAGSQQKSARVLNRSGILTL